MSVRWMLAGWVLGLTMAMAPSCAGSHCSAATCPDGCCDATGACRDGDTASACGGGGQSCATCGDADLCRDDQCVVDPSRGADAGACVPTTLAPSGRSDFAAAVDVAGQRLVLYGGDPGAAINCQSQPQFSDETWFFDFGCQNWTKYEGASPPPRARHVGVLDAKRRRFIIFGGRYRAAGSPGTAPYTVYNEVFSFNLEQPGWTQLGPTGTAPPPISNPAAVYDPTGDRMLVFGGNTSSSGATFSPLNELYALNFATNSWERVEPSTATKPPARLFHAMALDAQRNRLIVTMGGDANAFFGPFLQDVWAFDLSTRVWSELQPGGTAPAGRIRPALAADPLSDRMILFGGHDDQALGERNDLTALDLTTNAWTPLRAGDVLKTPGSGFCDFPSDFTTPDLASPERREGHFFGATPDGGLLMVGGRSDCGVLSDVWSLSVATALWTELKPAFSGLSCERSGKLGCTKLCF